MSGTAIIPGSDKKLKKLLAAMANATVDTLKSLIDKPVELKPGSIEATDSDSIVSSLSGQVAVIRGAFDKDYTGKTLRFVLEATDATAMAALMMMTPEEVIHDRRKLGTLEGEDLEAFGEVGNVLCSGVDSILRDKIGNTIGLRVQDHGVVKPGLDDDELLGDEPLIRYGFSLTIDEFPTTEGAFLLDVETAEKLNDGPLINTEGDSDDDDENAGGDQENADPQEEAFEDIPAAEIRGKLSCYLADNEVYDVVRRCCRRVGLKLSRHGTTEVPNPSAHKDSYVIIDVSQTEQRRFDWCKRLKLNEPTATVILLIHQPSRSQVMLGFMAKADIILGFPISEKALSQKISETMDAEEA